MEHVSSQDTGTQVALTLGARDGFPKVLTNEVDIPTYRGSLHYRVTARHLDSINGGRYVEGECSLEFDLMVDTWAVQGWLPPSIVKVRVDGGDSWYLSSHGFFVHNGKIVKDRWNRFGIRRALVRHVEEFSANRNIFREPISFGDAFLDILLSPIEERLLSIYTGSWIAEHPSAAPLAPPMQ